MASIAPMTGSPVVRWTRRRSRGSPPDRPARRARRRRPRPAIAADGTPRSRSRGTRPPRRSADPARRRSAAGRRGDRMMPAPGPLRGLERPFDHRQLGGGRRPGEQPATDRLGHQPGVEVTTRQAGHLADRLRRRRTGTGPEMLDSPAPLGQPGQHRQGRHRRFRTGRAGRQTQSRKLMINASRSHRTGHNGTPPGPNG